jgi:CBS domain-containing protein
MPASFRPPIVGDEKERTYTQTTETNLRKPSTNLTVRDILAEKGGEVHNLAPDTSVAQAAETLGKLRIGALLVMQDGAVLGILSERDVVRHLGAEGAAVLDRKVSEVMTPDPLSCHPADALLLIMKRMSEGRFRHMPVMEDGKLVGLISIKDVVDYRLRELEYDALKMKQMITG